MKKNARYRPCSKSVTRVNSAGSIRLKDMEVELCKDDFVHRTRKIEYWEDSKRYSSTLLTNKFFLDAEEIIAIYLRRWQIECLFKQLKQNFPLKYFWGESTNVIKIQIWATLIANLLLMLVKRRIKRHWSFSNLVSVIRQILMTYIDVYALCE